MIIVRVELHSARTHEITELARMRICNESGDGNKRDYSVLTYFGRGKAQLDQKRPAHVGDVKGHRAEAEHVWNLVAKALKVCGYGS